MALLPLKQAARELGIKLSTLRFWIWTRRIEYVKVGRSVRVKDATVRALIEEGTVPVSKSRQRSPDAR